jgi:hypothetical protein
MTKWTDGIIQGLEDSQDYSGHRGQSVLYRTKRTIGLYRKERTDRRLYRTKRTDRILQDSFSSKFFRFFMHYPVNNRSFKASYSTGGFCPRVFKNSWD